MQIPNSQRMPTSRDSDVMTSMIDVVFLLLIFFVVAAAGQPRESSLATAISAPGSIEAQENLPREPWMVEIWLQLAMDADGQTTIALNDRIVADTEALAGQLHAVVELEPETPVILDIDPAVPMRDVIRVDDLCRAAGFQSINFAARAQDVLKPVRRPAP